MKLVYKLSLGEEAEAFIYKSDTEGYEVYETPSYGGEPNFEGVFNSLEAAMYFVHTMA